MEAKMKPTFILVSWCLFARNRKKTPIDRLKLWNQRSNEKQKDLITTHHQLLRRRDALVLGIIGGSVYAKIVADALKRFQRGDIYPLEHELQVSTTFDKAVAASARVDQGNKLPRLFRILEIGVGTSCRSINRGLYDAAFSHLETYIPSTFTGVEVVACDIEKPNDQVISSVNDKFFSKSFPINFKFIQGDIMDLSFNPGYFDVITSLFVLCSVKEPSNTLSQISPWLRPGGTFGYVEHVAVDLQNPSEKGRILLAMEQQVLDPLQQIVAHNCHLHRFTQNSIEKAFAIDQPMGKQQGNVVWNDRFFVDDMWPVSCQCCGVIQKQIIL